MARAKTGETRACAVCAAPFYVPHCYIGKPGRVNLYCSKACMYKARVGTTGPRTGPTRTCKACGKEFYVYPSDLKYRTAEYCSHKCRGMETGERCRGKPQAPEVVARRAAAQRGRPIMKRRKPAMVRTCDGCGSAFTVPGSLTHAVARGEYRLCSRECYFQYRRIHPEIYPNFRGGIEPYYGPDWPHQKQLARERDRHTCQDCERVQRRPLLDVHHIVPRRVFGRDYLTANRLDNLVCLCKACHTAREYEITRQIQSGVIPWVEPATLPDGFRRPKRILRGEQIGNAVLNEEAVRRIRSDYVSRSMTYAALGAEHGVSAGNIYAIIKRLSWKHVK